MMYTRFLALFCAVVCAFGLCAGASAVEVEFEEKVSPLLWACSMGVELVVVCLLGSCAAAALAAQPLNAADTQSAIVSARILRLCFFISETTPFCWYFYVTKTFWDTIVANMFFICSCKNMGRCLSPPHIFRIEL